MLRSLIFYCCVFYCLTNFVTAEIPEKNGLQFGGIKSIQIEKVSLTQKGYIQFLRYLADIPVIEDFTFCIWLKSSNLTHSHPLLSYSHDEKDRYIRAWVTPRGERVNLYILEKPVFSVVVNLKEHYWYHICPSWSTHSGHWDLYINARLKSHGYNPLARGVVLPKNGDLVVGQEYTDFDKGLDDGIEGDIFGFNMALSSTLHRKVPPPGKLPLRANRRSSFQKIMNSGFLISSPTLIIRRTGRGLENKEGNLGANEQVNSESKNSTSQVEVSRSKRQTYDFPLSYNEYSLINDYKPIYRTAQSPILPKTIQYSGRNTYFPDYRDPPMKRSRIANDILPNSSPKSIGLQLVELSYNCALGKGAPLKNILISWTRTPVRVFGGAILKKIDPFCIDF